MIFSLRKRFKKYRKNPWVYYAISFLLTWVFLMPAVITDAKFGSPLVMTLIILSGIFGKIIPPILLTYLGYGRRGLQDYWQRLIEWKRISLRWWLISLLFPVVTAFLGVITSVLLLGSNFPSFAETNPLRILLMAVVLFFYGPLVEELGWTGYQLDRLQVKLSALSTGIIQGIFWMLWHLPMFFIAGSYQQEVVGFNTTSFWFTFTVGIICLQILQVWIYNHNHRSILSGVMIHFAMNFTGEMLETTTIQEYFTTGWIILFTVMIVFIWGAKTLTGGKEAPDFKKILSSEFGD